MSLFTKVKNIFRKKVDADSNFCAQHYDKNNFYVLTEFERETFPCLEFVERDTETRKLTEFISSVFPNGEQIENDIRHIPFAVLKGSLSSVIGLLAKADKSEDQQNEFTLKEDSFVGMFAGIALVFKSLQAMEVLTYCADQEQKSFYQFDSVSFEETVYFDSRFGDMAVPFAKSYIEEQRNERNSMELDISSMKKNPLVMQILTVNRLIDLFIHIRNKSVGRDDKCFVMSSTERKYLLHHLWRTVYMTNLLENRVYGHTE